MPLNTAKSSFNRMGEFPSKEHWQNYYGTVEDDFLEIDAIIGDIIYFYEFAVAVRISLTVKEKGIWATT